jgi:hypothetical protein
MALKIHEVKVIDNSNDDTKAALENRCTTGRGAKDIYAAFARRSSDGSQRPRLLKRLFRSKRMILTSVVAKLIKAGISVDPTEDATTRFYRGDQVSDQLRRGEGTLDDIDHLGVVACVLPENYSPINAVWVLPAPSAGQRAHDVVRHQCRWMAPQSLSSKAPVRSSEFLWPVAAPHHGSNESALGIDTSGVCRLSVLRS